MWEKGIICKFCRHDFIANELDIKYDDLRDPIFFVPDFQYYIVCPQCNEKLIQSSIPSDVAVNVQERIHAESTNDVE